MSCLAITRCRYQLYLTFHNLYPFHLSSARELHSGHTLHWDWFRAEQRRDFVSKSCEWNKCDHNKDGDGAQVMQGVSAEEGGALRPSLLLPQSPLITNTRDPLQKTRKRRSKEEDIDRLRRNPWAVALASPPRMCSVTGARLPRALLEEFGLMRRPNSDALWFMPAGLLKDESKAAARKPVVISRDNSTEDQAKFKKPNPLHPFIIRMSSRLLLLEHITSYFIRGTSTRRPRLSRLIPFKWRYPHGPISPHQERTMVWREDMPSFVLTNLRKETVKELKKACRRNLNPNTSGSVWTSIELTENSGMALTNGLRKMEESSHLECGGVLILGRGMPVSGSKDATGELRPSPEGNLSKATESLEEVNGAADTTMLERSRSPDAPISGPLAHRFSSTFPHFITLPQCSSRVPVFDLSVLLSKGDREELRQHHTLFQREALFFRPGGHVPVDAMLVLWRLKGFVMHDEKLL